jgi:hypothetical protein
MLRSKGVRRVTVTPRGQSLPMEDAIGAIARHQHGLVTRNQILEHLSPDQLKRRTGAFLERIRPRVYRVAGAPETWHQCLLAACLSAGPGSVASFRAAAFLWGLAVDDWFDRCLEITTPSRRRVRMPGVIVHDSQVLLPGHVTTHCGIPTTSVARTLSDLSCFLHPWHLDKITADAERRRLITARALVRVQPPWATRGRRRSSVVKAVIEERGPNYHPGGSWSEKRVRDVLVGAGFPSPVPQYRVKIGNRTVRLDHAYPELKIAIEYDGDAWHNITSAYHDNPVRQNELELLDWIVLRLTNRSTHGYLVRIVSEAFAARGALPHEHSAAKIVACAPSH